MNSKRILFIGAGRMAKAIVSGLVKHQDKETWQIVVSNRSNGARLSELRTKYGVETTREWQEQAPKADVILLAIPPAQHTSVLAELTHLVNGQFVISVAAGIGVAGLEDQLPPGTPVAWVMPNTAADIGQSISIYAMGTHVTARHRAVLEDILNSIGTHQACTERQVHELTAITGSAPAFIYRLAAVLEDMATEYGVDRPAAGKLVAQMLYGSATMLTVGGNPLDLADQVTTPGGATAAGLHVLDAEHFDDMLTHAIKATNRRAKELASAD